MEASLRWPEGKRRIANTTSGKQSSTNNCGYRGNYVAPLSSLTDVKYSVAFCCQRHACERCDERSAMTLCCRSHIKYDEEVKLIRLFVISISGKKRYDWKCI